MPLEIKTFSYYVRLNYDNVKSKACDYFKKGQLIVKMLFESQDPVLISYVRNVLEQEDIMSFIFDENISMLEGSIPAFQKRVMVIDDDFEEALKTYTLIIDKYHAN